MNTQTERPIQPLLFSDERQSRFEKYHAENPEVYRMFCKITFEVIRSGRKYFSSEAIINQIRWQTMIAGNDGFKINNFLKPYFARLFCKEHPEHADFFRFRKSVADDEI